MSERSRIMELERDLSLQTIEVSNLQLRLGTQQGSEDSAATLSPLLEEISSLRNQLAAQEAKQQEELAKYKEKLECQEKLHSEASAQLQAGAIKLSGENEELQIRLSQAAKEKTDDTELWKAKLESAAASHQQAMDELKLSLQKGAGTQAAELAEATSALERSKLEHKVALEEAAAKYEGDMSAWTQETGALKTQLLAVTEDKERLEELQRSSLEAAENQHLVEMEDVLGKLHAAELKVKALENKEDVLAQQVQDKDRETKEHMAEILALNSQVAEVNQELEILKTQLEEVQSQGSSQGTKVGACFSAGSDECILISLSYVVISVL